MLILSLCANLAETTSNYMDNFMLHPPIAVRYVVHLTFLLTFTGVILGLYDYVLEIVQRGERTRYNNVMLAITLSTEFFLAILSVCSNYLFYFDSHNKIQQGPYYFVWYLVPVYILINAVIILCLNHAHHKDVLTFSIYYMILSSFVALGMITYCPDLLVSTFDTAIFMFILSFTLNSSEVYVDKFLDCYNNKAFIEKANSCLSSQKPFTAICFTIEQYSYIDQVLGQDATDLLNKTVLNFLFNEFGRNNVYALYNVGYTMFVDSEQAAIDSVIHSIQNFFQSPISLETRFETVTPKFCIAQNPDFAKNGQHIIDEFNNTLREMRTSKSNNISYATGKYLALVQREQQVIYAMRKAIEKDGFEVYYQPIFDLASRRVKSLEALLRLNDEELGFIPPDEFIQIAERNGMIIDISNIAFRKVCSFIHDHNISELGIDYVEYNLSIVECDNPMLASNLLSIMEEYQVSPSQVNFEITETAQAHNVNELVKNMENLIHAGSTFSMDDYGTGYSTTHYLIKLPLHIVKIDKSILWPAMKDQKSYNVLRQLVATIKSIDKKIVVEGVETQEMVDVLEQLNCDFLQGYFYSKPVPPHEIVRYLRYANQVCS